MEASKKTSKPLVVGCRAIWGGMGRSLGCRRYSKSITWIRVRLQHLYIRIAMPKAKCSDMTLIILFLLCNLVAMVPTYLALAGFDARKPEISYVIPRSRCV